MVNVRVPPAWNRLTNHVLHNEGGQGMSGAFLALPALKVMGFWLAELDQRLLGLCVRYRVRSIKP